MADDCHRSFLQSSELGLPQPLTRRRVYPPPRPVRSGEGGTLAGERGESQFQRGDIHCGTLYIYMYFVGRGVAKLLVRLPAAR